LSPVVDILAATLNFSSNSPADKATRLIMWLKTGGKKIAVQELLNKKEV
jgi:hypothetical protein